MSDIFNHSADQLSAPARRAVAVSPHDVDPLPEAPKALYVGTGGNLVLRGVGGGADCVFRNVSSGTVLPFRARFVRAAGTSAADILALY